MRMDGQRVRRRMGRCRLLLKRVPRGNVLLAAKALPTHPLEPMTQEEMTPHMVRILCWGVRVRGKRKRAPAIPMLRQPLRFSPSWIGFRRIVRREKARWRLSFAWTRDLFLQPALCSRCIRVSKALTCIPVATST